MRHTDATSEKPGAYIYGLGLGLSAAIWIALTIVIML